jgi:formiminoglutamase
MIGGERVVLRGKVCPMLVRELFRMNAHAQTMMGRGLKDALDFVSSEGNGLAESVDTGRKSLFRGRRYELLDNFAHVVRPPVSLVTRQGVKRKESGNDANGLVLRKLARDFEKSKFAFGFEPIARFYLNSRGAAAHQRIQPPSALLQKLNVRGLARIFHGGSNAPACPCDLFIACARSAHRMLVGTSARKNQVRMTVDQTRGDPSSPKSINLPCTETGEFGPLADSYDSAFRNSDRAIFDDSKRIAWTFLQGRDVTIDEQSVPHQLLLSEAHCYGKAMSDWPNLSELLLSENEKVPLALLGAPLSAGSVTPGSCDKAPSLLRQTLKRIGRYDVEIGRSLFTPVRDRGDVGINGMTIEAATAPIRDAVAASLQDHVLTLLAGGNNAITRPAVLALDVELDRVGLVTLDAHFDMRDLDDGLSNGNPVRALMEDGLPGRNIAQIGLASFANTAAMHRDAIDAGNLVISIEEVRRDGIRKSIELAMEHMAHVDAIVLDCDIDVIDRSQMPGAPGARPGGMHVSDFFWAVRRIAGDHPSLDQTDLSALTAARWLAECVAGFENR